MSIKTQNIALCNDCLETVELKILQDWAISNILGDDLTTDEIAAFWVYRNSTQGQEDYNTVLANAPNIDEMD
jgi:hypothetical protein